MKNKVLLILLSLFCVSFAYASEEKIPIPHDQGWSDTNERSNSAPQLFQDDSNVYVYSEKQLDNLSIGITDMQGNVYHYEVTTVPAGMYYAVSIASLPAGTYYLSIYDLCMIYNIVPGD